MKCEQRLLNSSYVKLSNIRNSSSLLDSVYGWLQRIPETERKILCINACYFSLGGECIYFIIFSKVKLSLYILEMKYIIFIRYLSKRLNTSL
jgi:hypothetical protein